MESTGYHYQPYKQYHHSPFVSSYQKTSVKQLFSLSQFLNQNHPLIHNAHMYLIIIQFLTTVHKYQIDIIKFEFMKSKETFTNYEKRRLTYDKPIPSIKTQSSRLNHPLDLPPQFQNKITSNQYKRLKEAFFIQASFDLKLSRQQFPIVMRSLGIIQKTTKLYQIFDELQQKQMKWFDFLQAYLALRASKGSYNELANAVYDLDKQYRGNWDQLLLDLQKYGDLLTNKEIQMLRKDIMKGKNINNQGLINGLLYQR